MSRSDYIRGFVAGWKEALATVGVDLRKEVIKEFSLKNYGEYYLGIAREMGDCAKCSKVGTKIGCPIGETMWCSRITEE